MRKKTARKSLIIMLAIVITIAMMPTMAFAEKVNGGGQTAVEPTLHGALKMGLVP